MDQAKRQWSTAVQLRPRGLRSHPGRDPVRHTRHQQPNDSVSVGQQRLRFPRQLRQRPLRLRVRLPHLPRIFHLGAVGRLLRHLISYRRYFSVQAARGQLGRANY